MKTILTLIMLSFTFLSFSQSIKLRKAYIIEIDETTGDIIHQGKTKSTINFIVSDSTVHHTQIKKKSGELVKDVTYDIIKTEMIKRVHTITMKADDTEYVLLIPKNRRKKVALSSNKVTKVISGWTKKLD